MQGFLNAVTGIANESGFVGIMENPGYLIMIIVACGLIYLAIGKQFEPLLLLPIAFGMLLANLPFGEIIHMQYFIPPEGADPSLYPMFSEILHHGGLADMLYLGVKLGIYPPLIFLGIGTMTDFGPLISNPKSLLLGAAAQLGIFTTYIGAKLLNFTGPQAGAIGIIGGADGPTSIFLTMKLAPHLLGAVAVAAYTYMALVPLIQPPIMALLTTKKERVIRMKSLRQVSKGEKLFFAVLVTIVTILLIPDAAPLIGMLMLGNFMRECKVTERLVQASQNEIINIVTIFLGTSVGLTMQGDRFLQPETLLIILLGIVAFGVATAGGVIAAKLMNLIWRKNPVNPLIGSAGVSAVPMAARVSHNVGQKYDPSNYLLMHAMGPNVAGVIGTAVIAGYYIATLAR